MLKLSQAPFPKGQGIVHHCQGVPVHRYGIEEMALPITSREYVVDNFIRVDEKEVEHTVDSQELVLRLGKIYPFIPSLSCSELLFINNHTDKRFFSMV